MRTLALEQFDLGFYDEALSIDQYVRRSVLANGLPLRGEKVTARREVTTAAGAPVVVEEFEADDGKTKGVRLAYIHEGATGFMAIFYAPARGLRRVETGRRLLHRHLLCSRRSYW